MSIRSIRAMIAKIEKKKASLAKLRDEIRDLETDLSSMGDDCDEAVSSLTDATDALSRLV